MSIVLVAIAMGGYGEANGIVLEMWAGWMVCWARCLWSRGMLFSWWHLVRGFGGGFGWGGGSGGCNSSLVKGTL